MLDKLNEDYWALILNYVPLKDQLSLMQVSDYIANMVMMNWKRIQDAHMEEVTLDVFKEEPQTMHTFLKLASGSIRRLFIEGSHVDSLLPSWKAYDFPRLRCLHFHLRNTDNPVDNITLLLSKLFPKLTKLEISNIIDGHYLCYFKQLQDLSLHSSSLHTSALKKIFRLLPLRKLSLISFCTSKNGDLSMVYKCDTLEELLIDDSNLSYNMLWNLLELPKFRRLSFYTQNYYESFTWNLRDMNREFRVRSLVFNSCSWFFDNVGSCISRFSNLRRLVLQDDDIEMKQLYMICSRLKYLEELHLIGIRDFPCATFFWNMVRICRSLKVLNISNNNLDKNFLDESSTCLDKLLNAGYLFSLLTFHVFGTRLADDHQKTVATLNYPHFRISFDPVPIDTIADSDQPFIETEFIPICLLSRLLDPMV